MTSLQQETREGVKAQTLGLVLLGLSTLCLVLLCLWRNRYFFHDDAYITLRYASHLLAGFGPIWNKQGPRVEGFTSPLHMLLVAAVIRTGIPVPMTTAARVVNFTSHLVLLACIYRYLRQRVGSLGAQLGVMLVGASWMFLIWDLGGLDAVLYATLATIGVLMATGGFSARDKHGSRQLVLGSLVLAFGTLARPECFVLLAGAWILVLFAPAMSSGERLRTLAASIAVAATVLVPVEIFRLTYFHALAPNTMYAKMGGIDRGALIALGLNYLTRFLFTPPYLGLFAAAAGIYNWIDKGGSSIDKSASSIDKSASSIDKSGEASYAAIWMFIGLNALFVVVSGGDHMTAFRFCLTIYALLAIVLVLALARTGVLDRSGVRERPLASPAICAALVVALALQFFPPVLNPRWVDGAAGVGKSVGLYIRAHWPAGSTVALNTAGSTPFYADDNQYIDMLGLNDAEIARRKNIPKDGPWTHLVGHLKGDGASVLARKPDFIILGPAKGSTTRPSGTEFFIGDYEIAHSPYFQQNYQPCTANVSESVLFTYYQRRDLGYPCPAER